MILTGGNVFCDGAFHKLDVTTGKGCITALGDARSAGDVLDCTGHYVVPGFVEIHIHGSMGADFSDGSTEAIGTMARFLLQNGITSFLGTSMALPEERLHKIYTVAKGEVLQERTGHAVLRGINMEGPYFSKERRGAQNEEYIVPPSYHSFCRLNQASGGNIRTVAVAPEQENALSFIAQASQHCSVSLAHSTANYSVAMQAFENGANHVTHLLNGMEPFGSREPGIVGAAADSGAFVEVISDGMHLHPSMVRAIFKLFADDRICLISDGMRACGMPNGQYDLGGQLVTVENGVATIDTGSLAGSVTTLADCFRKAVSFGVPLEKALKAATINPASSVGLEDSIGSIAIGKRADLLVLDNKLNLKTVVLGGVVQAIG